MTRLQEKLLEASSRQNWGLKLKHLYPHECFNVQRGLPKRVQELINIYRRISFDNLAPFSVAQSVTNQR